MTKPELLDQLIEKQEAIDAAQARELHLFLDAQGVPTHHPDNKPMTLLERVQAWGAMPLKG